MRDDNERPGFERLPPDFEPLADGVSYQPTAGFLGGPKGLEHLLGLGTFWRSRAGGVALLVLVVLGIPILAMTRIGSTAATEVPQVAISVRVTTTTQAVGQAEENAGEVSATLPTRPAIAVPLSPSTAPAAVAPKEPTAVTPSPTAAPAPNAVVVPETTSPAVAPVSVAPDPTTTTVADPDPAAPTDPTPTDPVPDPIGSPTTVAPIDPDPPETADAEESETGESETDDTETDESLSVADRAKANADRIRREALAQAEEMRRQAGLPPGN